MSTEEIIAAIEASFAGGMLTGEELQEAASTIQDLGELVRRGIITPADGYGQLDEMAQRMADAYHARQGEKRGAA